MTVSLAWLKGAPVRLRRDSGDSVSRGCSIGFTHDRGPYLYMQIPFQKNLAIRLSRADSPYGVLDRGDCIDTN